MLRNNSILRTAALSAACLLAVGAAACGDDDPAGTDGGTADRDGGTADTLYFRLGGNSGIAAAVDAIVADELMDAEVAAVFTHAAAYPDALNATQIKECLVAQLGNAAGGPEQYPTTVSGGHTCRSMADAHAHLGITAAVFDKFVTIAAGTLTRLGVASADIEVIGGVLNSTKGDIATGPTLYQRLGGEAGISGAIDAIVAAEVMEPDIAAFFAQQGDPNHEPTVDQIKLCLVAQLGAASGGPQVYPTTVAGDFTCRSMADAHRGLGIDSAVFDKFVMIAGEVLTGAGVDPADVAIVASVLNSTKADVTE